MPLILQSRIYRADLRANPSVTYVFGDNNIRKGLGGQAAEMRGEPNAVGIATLSAPGVFWSDSNHTFQNAQIDEDMEPLFWALDHGEIVVFPLDGVGSGLANLANRSPETWRHLRSRISELKRLGGIQ